MDKLKKNIVKTGFGVAALIGLFLFVCFCLVMGELTESLLYYPIVEDGSVLLDSSETQYSDSVRFAVGDSGYVLFAGKYDPGLINYNIGKVLQVIQLYGYFVVEFRIDTVNSGDQVSDGVISWWVEGKDSITSEWKVVSDTAVFADPGSLFVVDTLKGYVSVDSIGFVPFDFQVIMKCDSAGVGIGRLRDDSYFDGVWRSGKGRY